MGEIKINQPLGSIIFQAVKEFNLKRNLEIGSWDGTGATTCFIEGMKDFTEKSLTCLEIGKTKYNSLVKNVERFPWVKCYNRSSVDCKKLINIKFDDIWDSQFNPMIHFPDIDKEMVRRYYNDDIKLMKKYPHGFLEEDKTIYDSVLIDGGEFTGYLEFELLKDRTNVFFLDDAFRSYKTNRVTHILDSDPDWECIGYAKALEQVDWGLPPGTVITEGCNIPDNLLQEMLMYQESVRNGFAVFKRKEFIENGG